MDVSRFIDDDDERQEYHCLLLEGYSDVDARRIARAANDSVNSRRLSGPHTGDTRNGHGRRPLISDMTNSYFWENARSLGIDDRSMSDIEDDMAAFVKAQSKVTEILSVCTDKYRDYLIHKFGLGVEPASSAVELGVRLGVATKTAENKLQKVRSYVTKRVDAPEKFSRKR